MSNEKESVIKIGVIRTSSIGDVVLASACLSLIESIESPTIEVTWIGRSRCLTLLKNSYPNLNTLDIDEIQNPSVIVDKLSKLDFLVDLQTNMRSTIISQKFKRKTGKPVYKCPKNQIKRNRLILEGRIYSRGRKLPERALNPFKLQYRTMVDTLFQALQCHKLILSTETSNLEVYPKLNPVIETPDETQWLKALSSARWLAIAPGAAHETKRAPIAIFSEIIDQLKALGSREAKFPLGLVFLGDKNDSSKCESLKSKLRWNGPILDLSGKLELHETALALKHSEGLLGNDSSLTHISEAVDTPAFVLFGPTVEGFGFSPRMKESRAFSVNLGCRPCSKHGKADCRFGDHKCFWDLPKYEIAKYIDASIAPLI